MVQNTSPQNTATKSILFLSPIASEQSYAPAIITRTLLDEPYFDFVISGCDHASHKTAMIISNGRGLPPPSRKAELPELTIWNENPILRLQQYAHADFPTQFTLGSLNTHLKNGARSLLGYLGERTVPKIRQLVDTRPENRFLVIAPTPLLQYIILSLLPTTPPHQEEQVLLRYTEMYPCEGFSIVSYNGKPFRLTNHICQSNWIDG